MDDSTFNRMFERIEYFFDIHMNSYHVQIANLAYEEYIVIMLEIIALDGWEKLIDKIERLENRDLQLRLLTLLTPIDLEFCKKLYKKYLDEGVPEYLKRQPLAWKNFVDPEYLDAAKKLLSELDEKRKIIREDWC